MKIYIAGKISGDVNYRDKFKRAAEVFEIGGDIVLNPATLPGGLSKAAYMRICFAMIDVADMVVFLEDYTDSEGVQLERAYCQYIGKTCYGWPIKTSRGG